MIERSVDGFFRPFGTLLSMVVFRGLRSNTSLLAPPPAKFCASLRDFGVIYPVACRRLAQNGERGKLARLVPAAGDVSPDRRLAGGQRGVPGDPTNRHPTDCRPAEFASPRLMERAGKPQVSCARIRLGRRKFRRLAACGGKVGFDECRPFHRHQWRAAMGAQSAMRQPSVGGQRSRLILQAAPASWCSPASSL